MKSCANCTHWDKSRMDCAGASEFAIKDNNGEFGLCLRNSPERQDAWHDLSKYVAAAIDYGEGIEAEFITRCHFCCSEYKENING